MAIIKQGILGGFKKKIGSVVGSSWKGIATMRSLPLSVANPKTAAQVSNRDRFKACAEFASLILASIIKPLMDRFAGQMSGYNYFTKLNKEIWANPLSPTWANLIISRGKMIAPVLTEVLMGESGGEFSAKTTPEDRYGLPTDKLYALVVDKTNGNVLFSGDTGTVRTSQIVDVQFTQETSTGDNAIVYAAFLRADGSEVSNTGTGQNA